MTRLFIAAGVLSAAALSALGQVQTGIDQAQPAAGQHDMQTPTTPAEMKQSCEKVKQEMQTMQSDCQRMDQQLQQQVQRMKDAQGEAKTEAIASTVEMMAKQQQQLREKSQQIMPKIMQHMQKHAAMSARDPQQGQQAMSACPMMQPQEATARPAGQTMD